MASTSSVPKSFKYDVFLSFRGEDTRKTFVDHLYVALVNKGIITYKDDETIDKGERIKEQLMRSIQDSRFYIIVFSKNYASSSWCLDELVEIIKCQKTAEHTAYPIFYDVEPTEVRHQSGAFGEAFEQATRKRKRTLEDEKENDVGRWKNALKEAAYLAGMELKNTFNGHEAKFIQQIVQDVSLKLHLINLSIDRKLVGMETRSFVEDVREVSKGSLYGLKDLQKQILSSVLNDQTIVVAGVSDGKSMMKRMMPNRKVLVVLDDVDDIDQLEALAGEPTWFKPGSRIIITTRDEQVLVAQRVNVIHDVTLLSDEEAICLFSRYAFGREIPDQGYEELLGKVIHYAAGLPLTIKVLGSHLCGRTEHEWVDTIERLKTIPLEKTLKRLELSYNGLENDEKEIFLDVVCILKGEMKDDSIRILESCGFKAHIGLRVLEQKSLITISDYDGLRFHDHIEEMGWNIVRGLHPLEPSKHSRLWIKEEIEDILVNELGTEVTRSIKLKYTSLHPTTIMRGLRKLRELRFLSVHVHEGDIVWAVDEVCQYLPDALQSLHWPEYPFRSLPQTFQANKLVNLEMVESNISELWEGGEKKVLNKIRFIDLSYSKLETFDLSMTPNLEKLNLEGCCDFFKLHIPVECPKLKFLDLTSSKVSNLNLRMIPHLVKLYLDGCNEFVELHLPIECPNLKSIGLCGSKVSNLNLRMTPHLEVLYINGCKELVELHLPVECSSLKFLYLRGSKVSKLNLGNTQHLDKLNCEGCYDFVELHMPVEFLNLKSIDLSGSKVSKLNLGMTPHLEELNLEGCNDFVELYMPVECPKLKFLNLKGSKVRDLNLMAPNLEKLNLEQCNEFVELHLHVECLKIKSLNLSGSKVCNLNLGITPNLESLSLKGCYDFVELHMPVECPELQFLYLGGSKVSNLNLEMTQRLKELDLEGCYYLQEIHAPVGCLKNLVYFNFNGCSRFKHFVVNKWNKVHDPYDVVRLNLIAESLDRCPLHPESNVPKFQFNCIYWEPLPSSIGNIEKLISFGLCACTNLESFSTSICGLQHLSELTLIGSIPEVPNDLYQLQSLEKLRLSMKEIKHLPDSICMLKRLKSLDLYDCRSLQDIPDSICKMESLSDLNLQFCLLVKKLPKEFGDLKRLNTLNIVGAGIRHLPYSIFRLKGLRITGSRGQLESCGFTNIFSRSGVCYVQL
ncbi:putative TIR domain, P-loop containing nucleoside triphosphate hydrolase [Helianthus annuus]|nr:putative TIR domain, P-loop containing nucleoside triphosphate hydrolase [Helianthus annuus]